MNVLAITGRRRDAAAAVASAGRIVAAASEESFTRVRGIGYTQTGGFPIASAAACLTTAGLRWSDIDRLAVVDDDPGGEPFPDRARALVAQGAGRDMAEVHVDPAEADARQVAGAGASARSVLVMDTDPVSIVCFSGTGAELRRSAAPAGADRLDAAARALARRLGLPAADPFREIDRLSLGAEPEFEAELSPALTWRGETGFVVDEPALARLVDSLDDGHGAPLTSTAPMHVRVQEIRRALGATFMCRLAGVIKIAADGLGGTREPMAFGGAMVGNPRFASELHRLYGGDVQLAGVPERIGRALGAALTVAGIESDGLPALGLGPSFSDADIKHTLDNCRLDYLYEPDWPRLLARVSKLISQGKVVGWFQGAMAFGPRSRGSRSILCDPSQRYARHNMNEYLRQVPIDDPLPVLLAPSAERPAAAVSSSPNVTLLDVAIAPAWREPLRAALDSRGRIAVNAFAATEVPELSRLLDVHFARTGVPGLIETNLCGPGEPVACTPRDAVRTVHSSAIDALVVGQFLLMKDYWLLRSHVD